jgi:DNA repair protein RadC
LSDRNTQSIKNWSEDDRPREKFISQGPKSLSNSELLAIIIGNGFRDYSALDLAKSILNNADNSLDKLSNFDIHQFQKQKGIGLAKAVSIGAVFELSRRRLSETPKKETKITSSEDAYRQVLPRVEGLKYEEFGVVLLNRANRVLAIEQVSRGGVSATVIDCKILFNMALAQLASGIILYHNHPSGQLSPSKEDIAITQKIKEGAKVLDIALLDHIIVTDQSYFSFADKGQL